ncbi:hypothetical protein [Congzhengia minquanensis]|jgi:lipoprotein|uniref:Uncharacterized protein n=1 Tax=Congzhengia minquanensis TaxID=2763657 RepID=A0A926DN24_9FIRM|nr:hypothetical protein [Congzhengia minquanensis]MBC8540866.1 hypothetical protein [Congzhengia minquanensis]
MENGKINTIITVIIVIFVLVGIGSCSSTTNKEYKCSRCGKTFTNSTDTSSIAWTSRCKPCDDDYKLMEEIREAAKTYSERYGN